MKTVGRFVEGASRLYEQGTDFVRIGEYVRLWWRWVRSGVDTLWLDGVCIVSLLGLVIPFLLEGFGNQRIVQPHIHPSLPLTPPQRK
ncbi:hypothetical protein [Nostoc sp. PCC 9305]|uniref:hypothetical protein n=1 Tax=Nostoc sp. PCC 9305 TaxID=296636 RepID=UPI0039C6D572